MIKTIPAVDGGYRVILADPPWHFVTRSKKGRDRCPDARHYETMSLIDIARLPVGEVAAKDSVLMLWVTDPMLHMADSIDPGLPSYGARQQMRVLCLSGQQNYCAYWVEAWQFERYVSK